MTVCINLTEAEIRVLMLARENIAKAAQDATVALGQNPREARAYATLALIELMLGDGMKVLASAKVAPKICGMLAIAKTLAMEGMDD